MTESALTPLALQNAPILRHLKAVAGGGGGPTAIAKAIGRDKSNVAKSLKALADAGLVHEQGQLGWYLTHDGKEQLAMLQRADGAVGDPEGAIRLRHDQIRPDTGNDRRVFDPAELAILADSLFNSGLQQPPKVLPAGPDGLHELVMGERRWRAWGLLVEDGRWPADHTELCPVGGMDDVARREAALAENAARVDLNHMEYAHAFERLAVEHGRSNKQIAATVGRTPEFVQQHRRLVKLDDKSQALVATGKMSFHDALQEVRRSVAALDPQMQLAAAEIAAKIVREHGALAIYKKVAVGDLPSEALDALKEFFQFSPRDYETLLPGLSAWYGADNRLRAAFPWLADKTLAKLGIEDALRELRHQVLGVCNVEAGAYWTPWLNGPFELSAEAAALKAKRAEDVAKQKTANQNWEAQEAARRREYAEQAKKLQAATAKARELVFALDRTEDVKAVLADAGYPLPWKFVCKDDDCDLVDAAGEAVDLYGAGMDVLAPMIMAVMNAVIGEPPQLDVAATEAVVEVPCRFCGCTESRACETEDGPCHWVEADVCSNPDCVAALDAERDAAKAPEAVACSDGVHTGPLAAMLSDDFSQQLKAVRDGVEANG